MGVAALLMALASGSAASAQPLEPAVLDASLEQLAHGLRTQDMAALTPALAPDFRIGDFAGDMALSILAQVIGSGRLQPTAIRADAIEAEGAYYRVRATFELADGARTHDLLVTPDGRFVEINVMRVTATSETQVGPSTTGRVSLGDAPTTPLDGALRAELLQMREDDQRYRSALTEASRTGVQPGSDEWQRLLAEQSRLDSTNVDRLSAILDAHGWPSPALVGPDASLAAFLVLQHASLEIQERYLPMVRAAAEVGHVRMADVALLEDRIRMRRGEPQLYGSQLQIDADGRTTLWSIEDEANVDARRAAVGLEPLADYLRRFGVEYTPAAP